MRNLALALLSSIWLIGPTPAPAQAPSSRDIIVLRGSGSTITCAIWLEQRAAATGLFAAHAREQYRSVAGWALGYLSGAARHGQNLNPLRETDEDAAIAWLVAYCERNATMELRRALDAFIDAHPAK
ncbi:hypothetical protein [Neoroseomonas soli]|uniref:Rap1a immunity protein domain-containing protein n=1 Tax=Neoroseomonas soli TaxID=1081025 RepID=A0A9X9X3W2_9PROT|nr:hypothetical protein [Neoroseomonas soli]MBR0674091.1 hypothetical protein [Neoroseomonas soli]